MAELLTVERIRNPATVSVIGGWALNVFVYGQCEDFSEGGKVEWRLQDEAMLPDYLSGSRPVRFGGNALNTAARLRALGCGVKFFSVAGGDPVSGELHKYLPHIGVENGVVSVPDEQHMNVGVVWLQAGGGRMIRGRKRKPMNGHLKDEIIDAALADADVVVAASLKDQAATKRILERSRQRDVAVSYNPGSSEVKDYPAWLRGVLAQHPPCMLAVNLEELRDLLGSDSTDPETLTQEAAELADCTVCTLGKDGVFIRRGSETAYRPRIELPPSFVKDTTGAGDAAHALGAKLLLVDGVTLDEAAYGIVAGTLSTIQELGGHGDVAAATRYSFPGISALSVAS